ncbi:MAG TPA: terminase gpA endonuclease subunit [Longimicrobiaceae bacterium]
MSAAVAVPVPGFTSHPSAVAAAEARTRELRRQLLRPPPDLSVSAWADQYREIARGTSPEPGRWHTDRAPYLRGMMDAFSDPDVENVVGMCASQVAKTEVLINVLGYFIHQDPSPILFIRETIGEAEKFSKTRLAKTIHATPVLREAVRDPKSRDSGNTILVKEFPGGDMTLVGANAPGGLAGQPRRVVLGDELDRWKTSAGTEGDPWDLGYQRTANFWNRKTGRFSSPGTRSVELEDGRLVSPIERAFLEGDQRYYVVPCPFCGHRQRLVWSQLRWEDGKPETAAYACEGCGVLIGEEHKLPMLRAGEWRATAPFRGTASFHLNGLYSPWARWADLVRKWLKAQGNKERLQVFANTVLAESWDERIGATDPAHLQGRAVEYAAEVPAGVVLLTAGVDVQIDRLEMVVRGWGAGLRSWGIRREIFLGDPKIPPGQDGSPWTALEEARKRLRPREHGPPLAVHVLCIDMGYAPDEVAAYCRPRWRQRVYAVRGSSDHTAPTVSRRPSRNNKQRLPMFWVGTNTVKDTIAKRLLLTGDGPFVMQWNLRAEAGFDADYFQQLTGERRVPHKVGGRVHWRWDEIRGQRHDALDCEVYALAAFHLANVSPEKLEAMAAELAEQDTPAEPTPEEATIAVAAVPPPRKLPRPRRRGWAFRS